FGVARRELDEAGAAAPGLVRERVQVQLAEHALPRAASRAPPRPARALEGVEDEVDAHLRDERHAALAEDVVLVALELVAVLAREVGGEPAAAELAVLLPVLGERLVERQLLVHLIDH